MCNFMCVYVHVYHKCDNHSTLTSRRLLFYVTKPTGSESKDRKSLPLLAVMICYFAFSFPDTVTAVETVVIISMCLVQGSSFTSRLQWLCCMT